MKKPADETPDLIEILRPVTRQNTDLHLNQADRRTSPLPAFVQNWSHVPAAETSVDLTYPLLPFSPQPVLGESRPSATACGLKAKASAAAIRRFRPAVLGDTETILVRMEASVGPGTTGDCSAMAPGCAPAVLDMALAAPKSPRP